MDPIVVAVYIALTIVALYLIFKNIIDKALPKLVEQVVLIAKEKLEGEKKEIMVDMSNKKDAIERLIKRTEQTLEKTLLKIHETDKQTAGSFAQVRVALESQQKITEQLSITTEGLKNVLSNNQLRGQFGEQVAEDLLKMTGFVKGVDYRVNTGEGKEGRPDFTILLPDGVKINVDSKFPYTNLQRATEVVDKASKREYLKSFERDVKEKIKQLTSRAYINPAADTVDFVVMFIPNEMIFSYIYERMNSVWSDGMKQKVIFAGPFSFTAILRLIRQSYDNFKYQKNVKNIIKYIQLFEDEFEKYNQEFTKIGERISSLQDQYIKVESTRTRQLLRTVDKIKIEEKDRETPLLEGISDKEKSN